MLEVKNEIVMFQAETKYLPFVEQIGNQLVMPNPTHPMAVHLRDKGYRFYAKANRPELGIRVEQDLTKRKECDENGKCQRQSFRASQGLQAQKSVG